VADLKTGGDDVKAVAAAKLVTLADTGNADAIIEAGALKPLVSSEKH